MMHDVIVLQDPQNQGEGFNKGTLVIETNDNNGSNKLELVPDFHPNVSVW